jgi:death-on-curing protein
VYLSPAEALLIAEAATGIDAVTLARVCRLELLDSALHAPQAGFGDEDFYPGFVEKAAVLVVRIARNHLWWRRSTLQPTIMFAVAARGSQAGGGVLRQGERPPKMIYTFIARSCVDLPTVLCCRVMKVSTAGFCGWRAQPFTDRDWDDALLTNTIFDIHRIAGDRPQHVAPVLWKPQGARGTASR